MALFNKLFSPRTTNASKQQNVSEKHFGFTKEQVRVVLFRECDFRGRKLLFDSTAIKKIQINSSMESEDFCSTNREKTGTFAEISNGYGYMYIKPPTDSGHLAEMIFGLVAMSYRGSYFKIHNLDSPSRLMLTQVFPSPKFVHRRKSSASSHGQSKISNQSLEQSFCLDDSGTSISDHLSVHSTASDTFLICRPNIPLHVPQKFSGSSSSVVCDSGVYAEHSYSSYDGGRQFNMIPFWESMPVKGSATSFSNSTLYKRWLRSSSLDHSVNSSNSSMDETLNKSHQRTSKLGLAFIIHLTSGQEVSQIRFFMEHIAMLESMLWRARQAAEIAYLRPSSFLSVLVKMVNLTSAWLTNLLSSPLLPMNLWTSLHISDKIEDNSGCDKNDSINMCSANSQKETLTFFKSFLSDTSDGLLSSGFSGDNINLLSNSESEKYEFSFQNITRIIKNEWDYFNSKLFGNCSGNNLAETFIQEFCELLDTIDVKDTNFFMSTLLTAVLTHHLGWVATCLPQENEDHIPLDIDVPFNPLWGQLCDLYGAVGHPSKMSQTVIMGNKRRDIISKIINCLTYFIRCSELERKNYVRTTIDDDNRTADYICHKNSCIPKENFKKYKDHLREMLNSNNNNNESPKSQNLTKNEIKSGLHRSKKTQYDLKNLDNDLVENSNLLDSTTSNKSKLHKNSNWMNLKELGNLVYANSSDFQKSICDNETKDGKENVVFVLGDDEKLVNIKKGENSQRKSKISKEDKSKSDKTVEQSFFSRKTSVPNFLESIFKKYETFEEEFSKSHFKDEDFVKYETDSCIKPSTSWVSLLQAEEEEIAKEAEVKLATENDVASSVEKPFVRSQSEPPESKVEPVKEEIKAKYRYSGVKFSLHQYPQVVTNYMRSKNLEMSNLSFSEITKRFDQISSEKEEGYSGYSQYDIISDEMEALQTPSNASELEYTSEINVDMPRHRHARESSEKPIYLKTNIPNVSECVDMERMIKVNNYSKSKETVTEDIPNMRIIYFPMANSEISSTTSDSIQYPLSLIRGLHEEYIPDLVLQGTSAPKEDWEATLKNGLALSSQHCFLDQPLEEAVAIIANTDTWEVQLVSSHTYVIDKNSSGVKVGMSQLIASMLDSLLKMYKLQVPPQLCVMHIEQRLQALCVTSRAVAQLLLATEFCSMEFLTSTLHLEVNDVPLLLAVASTFSPQVTQKYGISFQ